MFLYALGRGCLPGYLLKAKEFSRRKLVGARFYGPESDSAQDMYGHGTHTASTAAGREVKNASFYGLGRGTARGGAPSARIAIYKACSPLCLDTNILAAFDDAIADGVDIISISISLGDPVDIKYDAISIAAFHAVQKGILTVQSAGNNGPIRGGISSVAPWVFSVGASTLDRAFFDRVELGNGCVVEVCSFFGCFRATFIIFPTLQPLFYTILFCFCCLCFTLGWCY